MRLSLNELQRSSKLIRKTREDFRTIDGKLSLDFETCYKLYNKRKLSKLCSNETDEENIKNCHNEINKQYIYNNDVIVRPYLSLDEINEYAVGREIKIFGEKFIIEYARGANVFFISCNNKWSMSTLFENAKFTDNGREVGFFIKHNNIPLNTINYKKV